ncbi:hypothetical protein CMK22_18665 [Candidatus Poribacteria bacterium]|nr:hypothetical protein [Candidatus Poribacteria bacterium]
MNKGKYQLILLIIAFTVSAIYSSQAQKSIRIRGGVWADSEDTKGRLWHSGLRTDQEWGGYVGLRPQIVRANPDNNEVLSKEAKKLVQDAGYDLEMMGQGAWCGREPDEVKNGIQYKVNTGNGKFDVTLIIAEYWEPDRHFGLKIEGKVVAKKFKSPLKGQAIIETFKNIRVSGDSMEIHLTTLVGVPRPRPIFMGLDIYPAGKDPRLVDVQDKLTTTWGRIKNKN